MIDESADFRTFGVVRLVGRNLLIEQDELGREFIRVFRRRQKPAVEEKMNPCAKVVVMAMGMGSGPKTTVQISSSREQKK